MSGKTVFTLNDILRDADSIFEDIFGEGSCVRSHLPENLVSSFFPPADIYTDKGDFVVEAAVAGYSQDQISLKFEDEHLELRGGSLPKDEGGEKKYAQKGIKRAAFVTKYTIPTKYDVRKATADLQNGILTVRIPTREDALPREINIKISK